jgi:hypothetical protein
MSGCLGMGASGKAGSVCGSVVAGARLPAKFTCSRAGYNCVVPVSAAAAAAAAAAVKMI